MVFGLIAAGSCHCDLPGSEPTLLQAGDFLLLTAPDAWIMRGGAPVAPIEFEPARDDTPDGLVVFGDREGRDVTRIIGGYFAFDTANADLMSELLPPVTFVRSPEQGAKRLRTILELIDDEVSSDRHGQSLVLGRLMEIMLLETLRARADSAELGRAGLLPGLADPKIAPALRALHADVQGDWSVEALARHAGMSRSAFAELFNERVGAPPMAYLLHLRIALAKDALRYSDRSLMEIAVAIGYRSTSAFSTAFRREVGSSPGVFGGRRRDQVKSTKSGCSPRTETAREPSKAATHEARDSRSDGRAAPLLGAPLG